MTPAEGSGRPAAQPLLQVDNERVRVTEWRFAPGAATGWHRHEMDYVVVPLRTGRLLIETDRAGGPLTATELEAGRAYYRERGIEHNVINGSDGPFAFVEVELTSRLALRPYTDTWPAGDPDAGFRTQVADYSRIDPLPTLERLSADKAIPVEALVRFVLARYATSGSDALLEMGPRVVRQMDDLCRKADEVGTDQARLDAYQALRGIVSWLLIPLDDPAWRPGGR